MAGLARLEAEHGDPMAALDYLGLATRSYHDSGNALQTRSHLAILTAFLDRLGRYESAATIAGFAGSSPMTAVVITELDAAISHLRQVLGNETYESLAGEGEAMTTAAVAAYAHDQIDRVRTELERRG